MSHLNFVTISRIGASCESISISTHCPTDLCAVSLGKHSDSCRHNTTHILSIENAGTGKTWKLQQRKLEQQTASFVKPRAGDLVQGTAGVWSLESGVWSVARCAISPSRVPRVSSSCPPKDEPRAMSHPSVAGGRIMPGVNVWMSWS